MMHGPRFPAASKKNKHQQHQRQQCEQTQENDDGSKGCKTVGVCGKTPLVAGLQDLTMFSMKGLAAYAVAARAAGLPEDPEINTFING